MDLFPAHDFVQLSPCGTVLQWVRDPASKQGEVGVWGGCIISLTLEYFQILVLGVALQIVELTQLGRCFTAENVMGSGQMQTHLHCSSGGVLG